MKPPILMVLGSLVWPVIETRILAAEVPYASPTSEWRALFNGRDFAGWDKYIATASGDAPLRANVDPKKVFTVVSEEGEPAVHVSGVEYGAITTQSEFTNFHFTVQFKWGQARWGGRATVGRDTGILYCGIGQPNPRTGWLTSIENNIMEKGVGQWWSVNGALIDCEGEWITQAAELYVPYKKEGAGERNIVWKAGAQRPVITAGNGITPPFDVEQVFGNWNTVEVVFWGGQCIHILNGHVNLVAFNPRHQQDSRWQPLSRGKIQLQSEGAEVFYRQARIRPLFELPAEYSDYPVSPAAADDADFLPLFSAGEIGKWKQSGAGKFSIKDGVASGEGGMGLWWYSGKPFTNFVLRGEFLQAQSAADSGVFVRFPDPGNDPWVAVKRGHEFEIGDSKAENPTWHTGSWYPLRAPNAIAENPPGQWNAYEVVCQEHDYSVRINGRLVNAWTDTQERSLQGFIGLQNYNDGKTVRHRNLRAKALL